MCQPRWRGAAAGLLSFSFGIQERGAGEQAEMRGEERRRAGLWRVLVEPGETQLICERARVAISPPDPGGRRILVSLLGFFCLYYKLLGFGTRATAEAKSPLPGAAGRPLRGAGTPREPPGPKLGAQEEPGLQDEHMSMRGSSSLCTHWAKPREPPLWSFCLVPAEGSMALAALFVFLFHLHGSRCDQDSPKTLLWLFYFVSPLPFSFGRVQTLLWSLFCSGSLLSWPGACGLVPTASLAAAPFPFGFFCSCWFHHSNHLCHKTGAHWTISSP